MRGYSRQQERLWHLQAWAVWHSEALARTKRLPRFEKFANIKKEIKYQTWQEQLKLIKAINKGVGGKDLTNG